VRPSSGSPPIQTSQVVNYDAASNRLIVYFPGNPAINPAWSNQVWVMTNANGLGGSPAWIQLNPTGTPPTINLFASVVYDAATNRLIIYGGGYGFTSPVLSDVFVLSNANGLGGPPAWSQLSVTNPQARLQHTAVYHSASNRMIAFGGDFAFFGTDTNDTRILSNANGGVSPSAWSTLAVSGGPPGFRTGHTAVYDEANDRMTIFAGTNAVSCCYTINDYDDTWVLSNASGVGGTPTWTLLVPTGGSPPKRSIHSAAYDPVNNRMLIFGGDHWDNAAQDQVRLGDLWQLSNANGMGGTPAWTPLTPSGTPPGTRYYHTAAFDAANQRMILMGGVGPDEQLSNRVWVLVFAPPNTPPTAICHDVTVPAELDCAANASIDNGSFDPDSGDTITLTQTPPGPYPLGTTVVTLTVTDNHGATDHCTATVTVVDATPPMIANAAASPSVLWPPNHKMVNVRVSYDVTDNCDSPSALNCSLGVSSNEPVNGTGDGDAAPDWEIVDAHNVQLRAERAGNGNGRVYTITITCIDSKGNASVSTVTVHVPKNQH